MTLGTAAGGRTERCDVSPAPSRPGIAGQRCIGARAHTKLHVCRQSVFTLPVPSMALNKARSAGGSDERYAAVRDHHRCDRSGDNHTLKNDYQSP